MGGRYQPLMYGPGRPFWYSLSISLLEGFTFDQRNRAEHLYIHTRAMPRIRDGEKTLSSLNKFEGIILRKRQGGN